MCPHHRPKTVCGLCETGSPHPWPTRRSRHANRAVRTLQANRLESLPNGALAAPSHARVKIIHRSTSPSYPISSLRPVPDVPAGPVCSKWRIGPKHKTWRRKPPASLQAGRRGATTGFARPVTAQRWTCIEHGRPRARFQPPRAMPFTLCFDGSVDLEFWPRTLRNVP